jgi:DNA-binding HxlR family transcriptional regulator
MYNILSVATKSTPKRRFGCPVSVAIDLFGDRWPLIVVRDLAVRGGCPFREFPSQKGRTGL